MELPTLKPAELKYSRDVSLGKVKRWQITCCRSDSSHETELNQQIHTKRKVGFCLFYFLCGNSQTGFKQSSLLQLFAWFCTCILPHRKRIAAELPKVVFVEMLCSESEKQLLSCCHAVAMQKVKVNVRKWNWESAVAMQLPCWEAVSNLLPCCCHAKSESEREKVKVKSSCQAVDMLLPCKKWK